MHKVSNPYLSYSVSDPLPAQTMRSQNDVSAKEWLRVLRSLTSGDADERRFCVLERTRDAEYVCAEGVPSAIESKCESDAGEAGASGGGGRE
jgi:hypothetical protein